MYFKKLFLLIINVVIIGAEILGQGNLPFDPRGCSLNCTANDVDVTGAQLYSDAAGTTPLTSACTSGSTVIAYLGITFLNNSNANRGVTALATDIYFNGVFNQAIKYCPSLILSGGQTKVFIIPVPISWVCGEAIELRNIFGGWNVGGSLTACPSVCKDIIASKCNDTISTITVLTPPTALFSFSCATPITNSRVSFVNNSTGGPAANLSFVWNRP